MNLQLVYHPQDSISVQYGDQQLFRYVYIPQTAPDESPKPYFHPLSTLSGEAVTDFRPSDHLWHHGLAMTVAYLSGENFWGGPTYQKDRGYVRGNDHGTQIHQEWTQLRSDADMVELGEQLQWKTHEQVLWLQEQRTISVRAAHMTEQSWALELSHQLRNVSELPLSFGSPTTQGRSLAGYGSLFWRGPSHFIKGDILTAEQDGPEVMGQPSPWLAYRVAHTAVAPCTLVFVDNPNNPRYPNKWFVRNQPYACASYSFMFDEPYILAPGEELSLHYSLIIAHTAWPKAEISQAVSRLRP